MKFLRAECRQDGENKRGCKWWAREEVRGKQKASSLIKSVNGQVFFTGVETKRACLDGVLQFVYAVAVVPHLFAVFGCNPVLACSCTSLPPHIGALIIPSAYLSFISRAILSNRLSRHYSLIFAVRISFLPLIASLFYKLHPALLALVLALVLAFSLSLPVGLMLRVKCLRNILHLKKSTRKIRNPIVVKIPVY